MTSEDSGGRQLVALRRLSGFEVAADSPDVRGWEIHDARDRRIGRIDELIVDTGTLTARYLVVKVQPAATSAPSRTVLIPTSRAEVRKDRTVRTNLRLDQVRSLLPYAGRVPSSYDETLPPAEPETAEAPERRAPPSRGYARVTRAEEELNVARREVPAGELRIRKRVETEHVRQPVTRTKEDVHVERRPASEGARDGRAELREEEIRIPLVEEEVVVEKRPLVKEELVVAKSRMRETETVEADLRKERVDVERFGRPGDTGEER